MTRKYFGTDGIRGRANQHPMTADVALHVAMATAIVLSKHQKSSGAARVIIGKDTRLSGYMLEQAMASGFTAMGLEVVLVGPIPTPAIAMLTHSMRADIGVMISASHNPYEDNGIKLFGHDGFKLPDSVEQEIEAMMESDMSAHLPDADAIGQAKRLDDATGRYVEYLKRCLPDDATLSGLKIVIDCAHGAGYKAGPQILKELGAHVTVIGNEPNGKNINDKVGATATDALSSRVQEVGADIGIALDGDADRLIVIDETGARIDGDQILAFLALHGKDEGWLKQDTVVATVMSNLGFERILRDNGITLKRTPVGDRYVSEMMRVHGFNLGGEQSGHMIMSDYATTGDGLLTALQVLTRLHGSESKASVALNVFSPVPQLLKNVRFQAGEPLKDKMVLGAISDAEKVLHGKGRILVRASGTEPLIRVMAEGDDMEEVTRVVDQICSEIEKVA